jgi:hypothetical protein
VNQFSPLALIGDLVFRGRAPVAVHGNWLLPADPQLPAVRAEIFVVKASENATSVQLDVEIVPDQEHRLVESFAGLGSSVETAVQDAVEGFRSGALDVLLNVFWRVQESERVELEHWTLDGERYSVTVGQWLLRNLGAETTLPSQILETLRGLLETVQVSDDLYWIRIFYCNTGDGSAVIEIRLNNARWITAENRIAQLNWARADRYYSARLFVVLQRA